MRRGSAGSATGGNLFGALALLSQARPPDEACDRAQSGAQRVRPWLKNELERVTRNVIVIVIVIVIVDGDGDGDGDVAVGAGSPRLLRQLLSDWPAT